MAQRETKYFEIVTVTASKLWPWANMLPDINKCKNWMVEFISKFQGSGIKIDRANLIRAAIPLIFFNILLAFVR